MEARLRISDSGTGDAAAITRDLEAIMLGIDGITVRPSPELGLQERSMPLDLLLAASTTNSLYVLARVVRTYALRRGARIGLTSEHWATGDVSQASDEELSRIMRQVP